EPIAAGFLHLRPAGGKVGRRGQLVVHDGAVAPRRADDAVATVPQGLDERVQSLESEHRTSAFDHGSPCRSLQTRGPGAASHPCATPASFGKPAATNCPQIARPAARALLSRRPPSPSFPRAPNTEHRRLKGSRAADAQADVGWET